jgi:hypothetical protein
MPILTKSHFQSKVWHVYDVRQIAAAATLESRLLLLQND